MEMSYNLKYRYKRTDSYARQCSRCKKILTFLDFNGLKSKKLDHICKKCRCELSHIVYQRDPKKWSGRTKRWTEKTGYKRDPAYMKKWDLENPLKVKAKELRYRKKHPYRGRVAYILHQIGLSCADVGEEITKLFEHYLRIEEVYFEIRNAFYKRRRESISHSGKHRFRKAHDNEKRY